MNTNIKLQTLEGEVEVPVSLEDYKEAEEKGLSFSQLMNRKYPTDVARHGTAFHQLMASSGLVVSENNMYGLRPPTLKDIFDGKAELNGAIVRPDGSQRNTPAGRLLFPAVLIDLLEDSLRENKESYNTAFLGMVAQTRSVNSPRYDQVIIDFSKPRAARGAPISQLSEPTRMLTVTTSSVQRSMPTYSLGMEISREALQAATLDLIGLAVREHAIEERSQQLMDDFVGVVNGDVDAGEVGLAAVTNTAVSYDPAAVAGISHKAWVKYLRNGWRKRNITHAVCDIDSYLDIENRANRITAQNQTGFDERVNPIPTILLSGVGGVNVFTTEGSPFGTKKIVGLDSTKALRRVIYAGAAYNAVEEFVMRKSTAMRMDWAERIESAGYRDAFQVLTYA